MRPVEFIVYEKSDNGYYPKTLTGVFHQWGTVSTEYESGGGTDTVGIVETEDGKIHQAYPSNITFLDKL